MDAGAQLIFLVDDNEVLARFTQKNLQRLVNFEVIVAHTCRDAIAVLHRRKPDLLLLDVDLPDGDGGDIAAFVRSHPDLKATPIAFVSGMVRKEEVRSNNGRIGGELFFAKPLCLADLINVASKTLVIRK